MTRDKTTQKGFACLQRTQQTHIHLIVPWQNAKKGGSLDWWKRTREIDVTYSKKASQSKETLYEADVFTHILSYRALFLILSAYPHPDVAVVLYFGRTPPHLPRVLSELQFFFFPLLCHITIWEYVRAIYPVRPLKFHLYQPSRGKYRMQGNGHHYWALLPGKHNTSFFFWLTLMIGFFLQPWQGSSDAAAMEMRSTSG